MATDASLQLRMQQQQSLLFEDFSTEEAGAPATIDKMMIGELYQHKQQQNL